jgi:hypothetical protein
VECVVAVALGWSHAQGTHGPDSDWHFDLHFRGRIDPEAIRALGSLASPEGTRSLRHAVASLVIT